MLIRKVEVTKKAKPRLKVAAYARVSMESENLRHSLSTQVSYYSSLIQKNPTWDYVGVYADSGISGTSIAKRGEFKRMLTDAEAGKIDLILTKSIQRFARNTVDLLNSVRRLKDIGVEVRFEKENISTFSGDGELMLTILASFAQEEMRSLSDNVKWGMRNKFKEGKTKWTPMLGYRYEGDVLVPIPEEAEKVRSLFTRFLQGVAISQLARESGMPHKGIRYILNNPVYTGNRLMQRFYVEDPISHKRKTNNGELPQYWIENSHEAIVPMEIFRQAQEILERNREKFRRSHGKR